MPWSLIIIDVISFIVWKLGKALASLIAKIPLAGKALAAGISIVSKVSMLLFFVVTIILAITFILKIVKGIRFVAKKSKKAIVSSMPVKEESVKTVSQTAQTSEAASTVKKAAGVLNAIQSFK